MKYRYLVNSITGAVFTWNPVWAKLSHMVPTNERPSNPKKWAKDHSPTGLVNTEKSPSRNLSEEDNSTEDGSGEEISVLSQDEIEMLAQSVKSIKSKQGLADLAMNQLGLELPVDPSVRLRSMKSLVNKHLADLSENISS